MPLGNKCSTYIRIIMYSVCAVTLKIFTNVCKTHFKVLKRKCKLQVIDGWNFTVCTHAQLTLRNSMTKLHDCQRETGQNALTKCNVWRWLMRSFPMVLLFLLLCYEQTGRVSLLNNNFDINHNVFFNVKRHFVR